MAEKRPPRDNGDYVIGKPDGKGGQEETHNPVAIEPGENPVGHPGYRPVLGCHTAFPRK